MTSHPIRHLLDAIPDSAKHLIDLASIATLLGSLVTVLPAIASLFTIIWTAIRIYETPTVQALVARKAKKEPVE